MLLSEPGLSLFPWNELRWDSRPRPPCIAYRLPAPLQHCILARPQLWTRPGRMGSRERRQVGSVA